MAKEIEEWLRTRTQELQQAKPDLVKAADKPKKKSRKLVWIICAAIIVVLGVIITLFVLHTMDNNRPIPSKIQKGTNFTLYYPNVLPGGYVYQHKSTRLQNAIVFFDLGDPTHIVHVSEQVLPPNPPDLNHIEGFTKFETLAGNAAIGTNNDSPTAIVLSDTTLMSSLTSLVV